MSAATRPFSVIALAGLATLGGIWVLAAVAGLRPADTYVVGDVPVSADFVHLFWVVWGVILLASATLIALLRREGWALLMIATGLGLISSLWQWWIGNLEPVRMGILIVTAFYLNTSHVRDLLEQPREQSAAVPLAAPEDGRT